MITVDENAHGDPLQLHEFGERMLRREDGRFRVDKSKGAKSPRLKAV